MYETKGGANFQKQELYPIESVQRIKGGACGAQQGQSIGLD